MNENKSSDQQLKTKIKYIYQHLIKLGYPKILELSLSSHQQIQSYLSPYFQSTNSRLQLIQWLVAILFPEYREMSWYMTEKDPINKILKCLWKVGVMLVNKHTKNMDYKKYLQAQVGYQNAVGLVFNLVELAFQAVLMRKAKPDVAFGQFFHELVDNFTQLVNENYDIYGITFPCKFINPNPITQNRAQKDDNQQLLEEFQKQYKQFYENKMIPLLEKQDEILDKIYAQKSQNRTIGLTTSQSSQIQNKNQQNVGQLESFIEKLGKYGRQYNEKYNDLVYKIQKLLAAPETKSRLVPYYFQKKQNLVSSSKPSVKQSIQNRSIRISPGFCKKYQQYKRILRQIKTLKDDPQFIDRRTEIIEQIQKINEEVCL